MMTTITVLRTLWNNLARIFSDSLAAKVIQNDFGRGKKDFFSLSRLLVIIGAMLFILGASPSSMVSACDRDCAYRSQAHASVQGTEVLEQYTPMISNRARKAIGWAVGMPADGYGTILHTKNGGQDWERQGTPEEIPNVELAGVSALDAREAWVVGESDGYGVMLHTRDGGKSWCREGNRDDLSGIGLFAVSAVDQYTAWAVGNNGVILRTTNGGCRWERQGMGQVPTVLLQGVYASDASHVWVVGENEEGNKYGTILRTTDGGTTWEKVPYTIDRGCKACPLISVHGVGANVVWAVGHGQILHISATSNGISITDQTPPDFASIFDINGVFAVNRLTIWAVADLSNIWRSDNGGKKWKLRNSGHHDLGYVLRVFAIDRWDVWATTEDQYGSGKVLYTSDGGKNWSAQKIPVAPGMWGISFVK